MKAKNAHAVGPIGVFSADDHLCMDTYVPEIHGKGGKKKYG